MSALLLIAGAFLLGALPFSFWLARVAAGVDLRQVGSGNPGATNVLRAAGAGPALLALILDVSKGTVPVVVAHHLEAGETVLALTAFAALLGHVLSPFLALRGGKGVATAVGALAVLNPLATVAGVVAFLVVVAWKRYVSLASLVGAGAIAVLAVAGVGEGLAGDAGRFATVVVVSVVVIRHLENIRRLRAGEEPRIGERVKQT